MSRVVRWAASLSPTSRVIVFLSAGVMCLVLVDALAAVRPLAAVYLTIVPGLAIVRAAGLRPTPASLSLSLPLSLGVTGAIALALVAVGWLAPSRVEALVVAVTLVAAVVGDRLGRVRGTVDLANPDP